MSMRYQFDFNKNNLIHFDYKKKKKVNNDIKS